MSNRNSTAGEDADLQAFFKSLSRAAPRAQDGQGRAAYAASEHDKTPLTDCPIEQLGQTTDYFQEIAMTAPGSGPRQRQHMPNIDRCSGKGQACIVSVIEIARELHAEQPVCISAGSRQNGSEAPKARQIDLVLGMNRNAMRRVNEVLNCECSASSQVQLLLTVICGKVTAWYNAAGRNGFEGIELSSLVGNANGGVGNAVDEEPSERVIRQPIKLGGYSVDSALENKVRAQVVSNELLHVGELIERLSRRLEESEVVETGTGQSSAVVGPGGSGWPSETPVGTRVRLTGYLQHQLQVVQRETNAMQASI